MTNLLENIGLTDSEDKRIWDLGKTEFTAKSVGEILKNRRRENSETGMPNFPFFRVWKSEFIPPKVCFLCLDSSKRMGAYCGQVAEQRYANSKPLPFL